MKIRINSKLKIIITALLYVLVISLLVSFAYIKVDGRLIDLSDDPQILWIEFGYGEDATVWQPVTDNEQQMESEILAFLSKCKVQHTFRKKFQYQGTDLNPNERQSMTIMIKDKWKTTGILLAHDNTVGDGVYNLTYCTGAECPLLSQISFQSDLLDPESIRDYIFSLNLI